MFWTFETVCRPWIARLTAWVESLDRRLLSPIGCSFESRKIERVKSDLTGASFKRLAAVFAPQTPYRI